MLHALFHSGASWAEATLDIEMQLITYDRFQVASLGRRDATGSLRVAFLGAYFLLPRVEREQILGDIQEEYIVAVERLGERGAAWWATAAVLKSVYPRIKREFQKFCRKRLAALLTLWLAGVAPEELPEPENAKRMLP